MTELQVSPTKLPGVLRITPPTIHEDYRGLYLETWNEALYASLLPEGVRFVQDDVSISNYKVLRGIHGDLTTWKLISCLHGRIYAVVVCNDPDAPQYWQWEAFTLSDHNPTQILVPPKHGVGHLVMSDSAIFSYRQSTYYSRDTQFTIRWDDPTLRIEWPISDPILSERDANAQLR